MRHPGERSRLGSYVAVEEQLYGAKLEFADVAVVQELLDVGALRRVAKLVRDHGRPPGFLGDVQHFLGLPCIEGEGLLAQDVFARFERGNRERMMSAGGRNDRHGGEIIAPNHLHGIGIDPADPGFSAGFLRLFAIAAANGCDFPALGAKARHMDLRTEADTDDTDLACGRGHELLHKLATTEGPE